MMMFPIVYVQTPWLIMAVGRSPGDNLDVVEYGCVLYSIGCFSRCSLVFMSVFLFTLLCFVNLALV